MVRVAGWDIGGANCKACRVDLPGRDTGLTGRDADLPGRDAGLSRTPTALNQPLAVWREPGRLPGVLKAMADQLGPVDAHAVTMTAELCDCFASKADGVRYVLRAVGEAFDTRPVRIWTVEGRFRRAEAVDRRPELAAAANWLATGTVLARRCEAALLIDVGTTTTDLTPVAQHAVVALGRDDPGRLASGELVYTGFIRTPVCAVAPALWLNGREVRLAAELFAVTGDIYLLLGLLDPADYAGPTPDGRPATQAGARQRLARMLCADAGELGEPALTWLARQVMEAQLAAITRAAMQVLSRMARPDRVPIIGAGLGRCLAHRVAGRLGLPYADMADLGLEGGQAAPARAVADLLAEEVVQSWPAMPP